MSDVHAARTGSKDKFAWQNVRNCQNSRHSMTGLLDGVFLHPELIPVARCLSARASFVIRRCARKPVVTAGRNARHSLMFCRFLFSVRTLRNVYLCAEVEVLPF